jgi:hypothetical protein
LPSVPPDLGGYPLDLFAQPLGVPPFTIVRRKKNKYERSAVFCRRVAGFPDPAVVADGVIITSRIMPKIPLSFCFIDERSGSNLKKSRLGGKLKHDSFEFGGSSHLNQKNATDY